jgi:hypothetical protein
MKRLEYILELEKFLLHNPEVLIQNVMPECILTELYYFQRFQRKYVTK